MAGNRGKGDPMAGLLSGLGGIDPNLFNKPTMGQLKNKQQPSPVPPKPAVPAPRSDTIAAVGSPSRPDAATDSFSSQNSTNTKANPERSGEQTSSSEQSSLYVALGSLLLCQVPELVQLSLRCTSKSLPYLCPQELLHMI